MVEHLARDDLEAAQRFGDRVVSLDQIAEAALAHVVGGVEGAYFRSDLLERRRGVMEAWAEYVTPTDDEVAKAPWVMG